MISNQSSSQQKIDSNKREYKNSCYGRNCYRVGTTRLKVLYINKIGWFCDTCAQTLKNLQLVEVVN